MSVHVKKYLNKSPLISAASEKARKLGTKFGTYLKYTIKFEVSRLYF